jgi:hypothetical protein
MEGKEPKSEVHIMFWACFAGRRQGPIISLEGDPESPRREVTGIGFMEQALKPTLPDFMEEGMIFMQDNAGPHRLKSKCGWRNSLGRQWSGPHIYPISTPLNIVGNGK